MLYNQAEIQKAIKQKKDKEIIWEIKSKITGDFSTEDHRLITCCVASILSELSTCYMPFMKLQEAVEFANTIEENVSLVLKRLSPAQWESINKLVTKYSPEEFAAAVFSKELENEYTTPESIADLGLDLLSIKSEDKMLDLCCGTGTAILSAYKHTPDAIYTGIDINVVQATIAKARARILGQNVNIILQDVFASLPENPQKYDKIFANYPFGVRPKNLKNGEDYLLEIARKYPGISKATSSDWIFNLLIVNALSYEGKAAAIMTNGSTWNTIDTPIRKYFVENGLIELVVALPQKMFSSTAIATSLIVFSHGNYDGVRIVDATELYEPGRRVNSFATEHFDVIGEACLGDSEESRFIPIEQLRENEYVLNPSRYQKSNKSFINPVPLESVIYEITRGAQCTASQLDEMVSETPTNMQYLMLGNIHDGEIDDTLPYISHIDPKLEKYCLQEGDLILSKNGYPYKVAIAYPEKGQKILANGNLYIIRSREDVVQPVYLKAFFESEQGIAALKSITVGSTIPNIGVDKLKKLLVPQPTQEAQFAFIEKYLTKRDEVRLLKLKLEKAMSELKHIFDAECEEEEC